MKHYFWIGFSFCVQKLYQDLRVNGFKTMVMGFMRAYQRRHKKGYLICPKIPKPEEGEAENKVRNLLNFLLRKAVEKCLPDFDLGEKPLTTFRHTAFRLMLEDEPTLWVGHKLRDFANNGCTSVDQLMSTYITPIQSEITVK